MESRAPLFPGYLFACPNDWARGELLSLGSIIRAIPVPGPGQLLKELRQVDAALNARREIAPGRALFQGQRVRVSRGPLIGIEGVVAYRRYRRRRERLVLNVTMLGQAATLEVDVRHLQLIEPGEVSEISIAPRKSIRSLPRWRRDGFGQSPVGAPA
jgi:hypothetical protein